jgi:hypothetical protein
VIFRPRDMQEYYMLFRIFTRDVGLYSLSVFKVIIIIIIIFIQVKGIKSYSNVLKQAYYTEDI